METSQSAKPETPNRTPTSSSRQGKFAADFHRVKKRLPSRKSTHLPPHQQHNNREIVSLHPLPLTQASNTSLDIRSRFPLCNRDFASKARPKPQRMNTLPSK
jgi:hypothetical protein